MFKQLTLVALFFISNVYADDTHKTSLTKKIKKSPAVVKVFAAIVPCIGIFIAMNKVMIAYEDNETIVTLAYAIKWTAAAVAAIFGNLLMKVNLTKWIKQNPSKHKALKGSDPIVLQGIS